MARVMQFFDPMNNDMQTARPAERKAKTMTSKNDEATSLPDRLSRFTDELRLKAKLGQMELQDEMDKLRPRIAAFEAEVESFADDVEGRAKLAMKRARERYTELETKLLS